MVPAVGRRVHVMTFSNPQTGGTNPLSPFVVEVCVSAYAFTTNLEALSGFKPNLPESKSGVLITTLQGQNLVELMAFYHGYQTHQQTKMGARYLPSYLWAQYGGRYRT